MIGVLTRFLLVLCLLPAPAFARRLVLATYDCGMSQFGPGLLLQHLTKADRPSVEASVAVIRQLDADILLLTDFDFDYGGQALAALQTRLRALGLNYPESLGLRPNTGIATGLDLDHDGKLNGPRDAQAYGRFAGQGGMAILSRYPIDRLKKGDVITKVNNDLIDGTESLIATIRGHRPGEKVTITYIRDGKTHTTEATLGSDESANKS